ncbi:MAG: DnaJ domain-containing protein [Deltaproteobacteria bacterium]|nr:DnaJ domain-containing protein [Deltaproteobacteria bacterium]
MSDDRLDQLDYYELLRIEPSASGDDVRRAFHDFAMRYHPDRYAGAPPDKAERASQIYRRGAEAYRVLSNLEQRKRYDQLMAAGTLRYVDPTATEERAAKKPEGALEVKSLRARPFLQKGIDAEKRGDLQQAKLNFGMALQHEADNAALKQRYDDVVAKLKK